MFDKNDLSFFFITKKKKRGAQMSASAALTGPKECASTRKDKLKKASLKLR